MATKTTASKTVRASNKPVRAKQTVREGVEPVRGKADIPHEEKKIYEVSFENVAGQPVLFTVEHAFRVLLKESIADMPAPIQSTKPKLRIVTEPAAAHFKFKEWMKLAGLCAPGTWHYLANPKEFERSAKKYAKINPLARIFGKKTMSRKSV